MKLEPIRLLARGLVPVLVFTVFAAGCTATVRTPAAPAAPLPDERATFETEAAPMDVLDAATLVLINSNFTIALANERVGLVQTEYLPLSTVQAAWRDSLGLGLRLNRLAMRVTVSTLEQPGGHLIQVKGSFQRSGRGTEVDDLVARYWLERITQEIAARVDVSYRPHVTEATYVQAVREASAAADASNPVTSHTAVRAVAIVAALLFAATLVTGVLNPGAAGASN